MFEAIFGHPWGRAQNFDVLGCHSVPHVGPEVVRRFVVWLSCLYLLVARSVDLFTECEGWLPEEVWTWDVG